MTTSPKKLLVTGASGFLGWNLCRAAAPDWQLFGTTFTHEVAITGVECFSVDLTDYEATKALFNRISPDGVIHTAAAKDPNFCQENRSLSQKINVEAPANLAGLCAERNIPFVFTSTDMVFDGTAAPYVEAAEVSPINIYGEQKVSAENKILDRYPAAVVCRMPLMFGTPGPVSGSFLQPLVQSLKSGQTVNLFTDEFRTPIGGESASHGLLLALNSAQGILHLGGPDRLSRHDFGLYVAKTLNLTGANINACRQQDVVMAAPRPPDLSLDSSKAIGLGFTPLPVEQALASILQGQG